MRSKLEYGNVVWHPCYGVHRRLIESIQRTFLKYLSFKLDGINPERWFGYDLLLECHMMESLSARRTNTSASFAFKLVNNKVDCSSLLACLQFNVPRISSRYCDTFRVPLYRTNVLRKTPLVHCVMNANLVNRDICFCCFTTDEYCKLLVTIVLSFFFCYILSL